jgi:hypothetical protein
MSATSPASAVSPALGAQPARRMGPGESADTTAETSATGAARPVAKAVTRRLAPREATAGCWRGLAKAMEWPSVRLDRLTLWAWRRHHEASARLDTER